MVLDGEDVSFGVEMGNVGHEQTSRYCSEGLILDNLYGLQVSGADMREPDGSCVGEDWFN